MKKNTNQKQWCFQWNYHQIEKNKKSCTKQPLIWMLCMSSISVVFFSFFHFDSGRLFNLLSISAYHYFEINVWWILKERKIRKSDCFLLFPLQYLIIFELLGLLFIFFFLKNFLLHDQPNEKEWTKSIKNLI